MTKTESDAVCAHCPASGVKVYVPFWVDEITAGVQLPVMPLGETVCNIGACEPLQNVNCVSKSGIIGVVTVTVSVTDVAH